MTSGAAPDKYPCSHSRTGLGLPVIDAIHTSGTRTACCFTAFPNARIIWVPIIPPRPAKNVFTLGSIAERMIGPCRVHGIDEKGTALLILLVGPIRRAWGFVSVGHEFVPGIECVAALTVQRPFRDPVGPNVLVHRLQGLPAKMAASLL